MITFTGTSPRLYTPRLSKQSQQTALDAALVSTRQVKGVMQNLTQGQQGNQATVNQFLAEQIAELGIAVSKNTVALRQILTNLQP